MKIIHGRPANGIWETQPVQFVFATSIDAKGRVHNGCFIEYDMKVRQIYTGHPTRRLDSIKHGRRAGLNIASVRLSVYEAVLT